MDGKKKVDELVTTCQQRKPAGREREGVIIDERGYRVLTIGINVSRVVTVPNSGLMPELTGP